jgi:hypothetical protein
MFKNTLTG